MRRILAAATVVTAFGIPAAGASLVPVPHRGGPHAHRRAGHAADDAQTAVPLWLAGDVTYHWSGDQCATSAAAPASAGAGPTGAGAGAAGAGTAGAGAAGSGAGTPCQETFTNVVTASVSTGKGQLLAPLPGQQLAFDWYGDVLTPRRPDQWSCTIVVTGTGAAAGGTVSYRSYAVSSPDCVLDAAAGPPAGTSLEATGTCLSCSYEGYLGQPIRIRYSAPGTTVLDNGFPVNTNTR